MYMISNYCFSTIRKKW